MHRTNYSGCAIHRRTHHKTSKGNMQGFTLIELMITIAIIGILAAIAVPSYQNSIKKSRRADAQGALMGFANAMERHFTANGTYEEAAANGADTGAPTIFSIQSPVDGSAAYYNLTISAADTNTYTLLAAPINAQVGDGNMELDHTGARRWDEDNADGFSATENDWEVN